TLTQPTKRGRGICVRKTRTATERQTDRSWVTQTVTGLQNTTLCPTLLASQGYVNPWIQMPAAVVPSSVQVLQLENRQANQRKDLDWNAKDCVCSRAGCE
ncbi:hypothetical protein BaRGS_00017206, partial [Batillaria attramentaria]